jgi:hypothetical protein
LTKLFCGLYIVENIFHFLACFRAVECPLKFFTLRKVSKKFGIATHVICLGEKLNCFSSSCELLKLLSWLVMLAIFEEHFLSILFVLKLK